MVNDQAAAVYVRTRERLGHVGNLKKEDWMRRRITKLALGLLLGALALVFLLGAIPGVPNPFVNAFLWGVPVPPQGEVPSPEEGVERVLVLAPHPDDEVLGAGGAIADFAQRGARILVVYLTNGDANVAAKRLLTASLLHRATDYRALGYRRQKEAVLALRALAGGGGSALFLGYPDKGLMDLWGAHWETGSPYRSPYTKATSSFYHNSFAPQAVYAGQDFLNDLGMVLGRFRPSVVYVPHPDDTHPDHAAAFLFAREALAALDPLNAPEVRLYLVHAPHWPGPRGAARAANLEPPEQERSWAWESQPLSERAVAAKLAALSAYSSQRWTDGRFLARFVRPNEVYAHLSPGDSP